jgi:hypothetical protein
MDKPRFILAGGSGLLGQALARLLAAEGADVVVLTRSPGGYRGAGRAVAWDGERTGDWAAELEGAAGVVNLSGRNVNTRWTAQAKGQLVLSRVESARAVAEAIRGCRVPPAVWVNASAAGIYGDRGDEVLADDAPPAPPGADFLGDLCRSWEAAVETAEVPVGVRKAIVRLGVVFSADGGALPLMRRITKLFVGGRLGSGRQWMPWIHIEDATRAMRHVLASAVGHGTYNVSSPNPARNADLMAQLRRVLHRPPAPPAPAWAARLGGSVLGLPMEPALVSQRMVPRRLLEEGFDFRHPELAEALEGLLA